MSLQCGIFGLPNVGKSTCLNALSQLIVAEASNYPFCTIEPNRSNILVPDTRLQALAEIVGAARTIPAAVEFVDIAGLVKNASKGEGLGNQFLSNIRNVDALIHVVRCFEDPEVIHVSGVVDPIADIATIENELILSDLALLQRLYKNQEKALKAGDKNAKQGLSLLARVEETLNQVKLLRQESWSPEEHKQLTIWEFLTIKPTIYLANIAEDIQESEALTKLREKAENEGVQVITSCIKLEAELIGTSDDEKRDVMALLGEQAAGLSELIRAAYHLLGLHTFFTAGVKEVKAWTIPIGATAWEAAGRIHSDIQRGFIVAEVVGYQDFIDYRGVKGAKEKGLWKQQKKEYVVQDGDVIHFRFNV